VKDPLGHSSIKIAADIYGPIVLAANRQEMNRLASLKTPSKVVEIKNAAS
jgi:hypothetical protein